jgi:hypothetical protein
MLKKIAFVMYPIVDVPRARDFYENMAVCVDSEGNSLLLHQLNKSPQAPGG